MIWSDGSAAITFIEIFACRHPNKMSESGKEWVAVNSFDGSRYALMINLIAGGEQMVDAASLAEEQITFGVFEIEKMIEKKFLLP